MSSSFCAVCGGMVEELSHIIVFKVPRQMCRCKICGYTYFNEVSWLNKAYEKSYTSSDTQWVGRSIWGARLCDVIARLLFPLKRRSSIRLFEFGAGYGLTATLLSDLGYNVTAYDRYSDLQFFNNFISNPTPKEADIVYAFEVLEHLPHDQIADIKRLVRSASVSIFSTEIPPLDVREVVRWHYLGTEHGQHVSFYAEATMQKIASECGKKYITDGKWIHIFIEQNMWILPISVIKLLLRMRLCLNPWKI